MVFKTRIMKFQGDISQQESMGPTDQRREVSQRDYGSMTASGKGWMRETWRTWCIWTSRRSLTRSKEPARGEKKPQWESIVVALQLFWAKANGELNGQLWQKAPAQGSVSRVLCWFHGWEMEASEPPDDLI